MIPMGHMWKTQSASPFDSRVADLSDAAFGGSGLKQTSPNGVNEGRGGSQILVAKGHRIPNGFPGGPRQEYFVWGPASDSALSIILLKFIIKSWLHLDTRLLHSVRLAPTGSEPRGPGPRSGPTSPNGANEGRGGVEILITRFNKIVGSALSDAGPHTKCSCRGSP